MRSNDAKFLWASVEFDKWINKQKELAREKGFKMSTADVTHKLLEDVIIPNEIRIIFPVMKKRKKGMMRIKL